MQNALEQTAKGFDKPSVHWQVLKDNIRALINASHTHTRSLVTFTLALWYYKLCKSLFIPDELKLEPLPPKKTKSSYGTVVPSQTNLFSLEFNKCKRSLGMSGWKGGTLC